MNAYLISCVHQSLLNTQRKRTASARPRRGLDTVDRRTLRCERLENRYALHGQGCMLEAFNWHWTLQSDEPASAQISLRAEGEYSETLPSQSMARRWDNDSRAGGKASSRLEMEGESARQMPPQNADRSARTDRESSSSFRPSLEELNSPPPAERLMVIVDLTSAFNAATSSKPSPTANVANGLTGLSSETLKTQATLDLSLPKPLATSLTADTASSINTSIKSSINTTINSSTTIPLGSNALTQSSFQSRSSTTDREALSSLPKNILPTTLARPVDMGSRLASNAPAGALSSLSQQIQTISAMSSTTWSLASQAQSDARSLSTTSSSKAALSSALDQGDIGRSDAGLRALAARSGSQSGSGNEFESMSSSSLLSELRAVIDRLAGQRAAQRAQNLAIGHDAIGELEATMALDAIARAYRSGSQLPSDKASNTGLVELATPLERFVPSAAVQPDAAQDSSVANHRRRLMDSIGLFREFDLGGETAGGLDISDELSNTRTADLVETAQHAARRSERAVDAWFAEPDSALSAADEVASQWLDSGNSVFNRLLLPLSFVAVGGMLFRSRRRYRHAQQRNSLD
ncbi:MAG: hypothetical protein IT423_06480 [Pirellulaceae bacterium]|nr:hypothetical protein [Pirellulaceae bacterium]